MAPDAPFEYLADVGMADRIRAFDWDRTPLGPRSAWPASLTTLVDIALVSKQPTSVAWGPGLTLIYNDAYRDLLGAERHMALGASLLDVWSVARDRLGPLVDEALAGRPVHVEDFEVSMDRDGVAQESHFAFSFTPLRGIDGSIAGLLCPCARTTDAVLSRRRLAFLLDLEDRLRGMSERCGILSVGAEALERQLAVDRVSFVEIDDEGVVRLPDIAARQAGSRQLHRDGAGQGWLERQRHGETVASEDVPADGDADAPPLLSVGVGAFVSAPLVRDGRLRASLLVERDGARRWSEADRELIADVASRVWDAAERARSVQALRDSEARFSSLAQSLPNQVWTATPEGMVDWVNARVDVYVGAGNSILDGAGWAAVVHPDDVPPANAAWAASVVTGVVFEAEFRIRRADGVHRWHLVRAVPQHDGNGRLVRWIGTNTDIDEQKSAELEVAAARDQAEEANNAKSDFLANMSHELRTPLSAIIGYSEMMREEMEDGTESIALVPDMDKVEGNARHLLGLINDVLDLSKVESGMMDVYVEDFDVAAVVGDLASTVQGLLDKKGNRLDLRVGPDLGAMRSDLTKVRQVLLNLLSNAAKFTEGGLVTLSVERRSRDDGQDVVAFAVVDTGIGMTEEQLAKVFQRFAQADESTTRKFGGTGLGLSLTKAFADMLAGTVAVESVHGKGTTFTFTVPASHVVPSSGTAAQDAGTPAEDEAGKDLILVIDDDADQRELMSRFLKREGFRVRVAADGNAGLALARSLHPRAILLDVMMPGVDGWSVLSEIKADPDLSAIPVVMATSVEQRGLAESLGASDFMLKPVRWDRFSQIMGRFRKPDSHILLVEDSDEARVNIRMMLMEDGWEVTEAENGRDGLKRILESRPDAVLMDLNMPVMDGFDFLAELRKLPGCSTIPVVVLSARELTREDRSLLRGAHQILNKGDVSLAELVERLQHLTAKVPADPSGPAGLGAVA